MPDGTERRNVKRIFGRRRENLDVILGGKAQIGAGKLAITADMTEWDSAKRDACAFEMLQGLFPSGSGYNEQVVAVLKQHLAPTRVKIVVHCVQDRSCRPDIVQGVPGVGEFAERDIQWGWRTGM